VPDLPPEVAGSATPSGSRLAVLKRRSLKHLDRWTRASHAWIAAHHTLFRAITGLVIVVALTAGWFVYDIVASLPGREELKALADNVQGTTILDAHNHRIFTIPTQYQIAVPLSRISPNLKKAVVAVEDVRFYEHHGIDGIRIVGAVIQDIRKARKAEGASTITQQLARMSFLTTDKTLRRKIREAILAQRIEQVYSKDEILEFYLNKAYFGDGLFGAEAASRGYFGKTAADLTPAEGALLAGLVRSPSSSNPTTSLGRATTRRNLVLKLMLENHLIERPQYETAIASQAALNDTLRRADPSGVHFKEQVRRELVERYGKEKVYEGRLRVYTTIDPEMQRAAEDAVTTGLRELETRTRPARPSKPKGAAASAEHNDTHLEAAFLALDPATGEVRAIVGGRDTTSVGLNRALQSRRQPGSAFKPFVYAAALEAGYSPASIIAHLDEPVATYKGAWLPDDEHSTGSSMTIRNALRTSSNRAAVRMLNTVGIANVVSYARRLGVDNVPSVPSLALGAGEVTLVSMTAAYAAFAQKGIVRDPIFIRRVEDEDGRVIFQAERRDRQAVSESTAFLMSSMLADVVDSGTAAGARALGFTLPAAGKTGTTNDFVDAWFVGFTPKLVAGVWVGYDEPRTIMANGFAAGVAVPLWAKFMKAATKNDPKTWFEPPPAVIAVPVCRVSGMLPVPGCKAAPTEDANGNVSYRSTVYTDYFVRGKEPTETCNVHSESALSAAALAAAPKAGSGEVLGFPQAPPEPAPHVDVPETVQ
jgi:1A family penicillin-binding protein